MISRARQRIEEARRQARAWMKAYARALPSMWAGLPEPVDRKPHREPADGVERLIAQREARRAKVEEKIAAADEAVEKRRARQRAKHPPLTDDEVRRPRRRPGRQERSEQRAEED